MSSEYSDDFTIFPFFLQIWMTVTSQNQITSDTDAVMTARAPGADKEIRLYTTNTTNCADRQGESDCFITFGANKKTLHSML